MIHQIPIDESSILVNGASLKILNPLATLIVDAHLNGVANDTITSDLVSALSLSEVDAESTVASTLALVLEATREPFTIASDPRDQDYKPYRPPNASDSYRCEMAGKHFRVRSENPAVTGTLSKLITLETDLAPDSPASEIVVFEESGTGNTKLQVCLDDHSLDCCQSPDDAAVAVLYGIWGVAASAFDWMVLAHAGAVARGNTSVLFPADSGSGKSTLVAYLMAQGFSLLADDCVPVLDSNQLLQPVPKSISVKAGSWPVLCELYPELTGLPVFSAATRPMKFIVPAPAQVQSTPIACNAIVMPRYNQNAGAARLQPIHRAYVLDHLLNGSSKIRTPASVDSVTRMVNWLKSVECYSLSYSSLASAHQQIEKLFP